MVIHDPFARVEIPAELRKRFDRDAAEAEREQHALWFAEVMRHLVYGTPMSPEARMFIGGGGLSWLQENGDLIGEFWRLRPVRGSKVTAGALLRRLEDDESSSG